MNQLIDHFHRSPGSKGEGRTDGQLLGAFVDQRDEVALAALVRRHGGMVWGVCRRVLRRAQDAEDAFQATFLVLVQKAATLPNKELVGHWLYGVARQTAVRMRVIAARRGARESQVAVMPEAISADEYVWNDLTPVLDEEVGRLPDKYRLLIVQCDLEGKTRREVARHLDLPEGTVASRLVAARAMLARRLTRRGVVVSGVLLGAVLSAHATRAVVPAAVVSATLDAVALVLAGTGAGVLSPTVSALTKGVMNAMLVTRIKTALSVSLILGVLAAGATALTCHAAWGQDGKKPPAEKVGGQDEKKPAAEKVGELVGNPAEKKAAEPPEAKKTFTAWGEKIDGLQAGLGFHPGEQRVYRTGETVKLVVRVRNVGKTEVLFTYSKGLFQGQGPPLQDGSTREKPQMVLGNLKAGEEWDLFEFTVAIRPTIEKVDERPLTLYGVGTFPLQLNHVDVQYRTGEGTSGPFPGSLATGKLDLEVREPDDKQPTTVKPDAGPEANVENDTRETFVYGLARKDGARDCYLRSTKVGETVEVEGLALGEATNTQRVVYEGSKIFVRGADFKKLKVNGKLVHVKGVLRYEGGALTRLKNAEGGYTSYQTPAYFYIEASSVEVIDTVTKPGLSLSR